MTHSMHFIADPGFKEAIRSFLMREERAMKDLEEAILLAMIIIMISLSTVLTQNLTK